MGRRKPILADHKNVKSKLVAPFNEAFAPMREVSWINTIIPELLWIALIQEKYGPQRGVEIIAAFTRDVRASEPSRQEVIWAAAGKYASIPLQPPHRPRWREGPRQLRGSRSAARQLLIFKVDIARKRDCSRGSPAFVAELVFWRHHRPFPFGLRSGQSGANTDCLWRRINERGDAEKDHCEYGQRAGENDELARFLTGLHLSPLLRGPHAI